MFRKINENKNIREINEKRIKNRWRSDKKEKENIWQASERKKKILLYVNKWLSLLLVRRIMCHMRKKILREPRTSVWHAQIPETHEGVLEAIAVVLRLVVFFIARVFVLIGLGEARGRWVECLSLRTLFSTSRLLDLHGTRRHASLAVISSKITF